MGRGLRVGRLLSLLDQRQDIAHAQDPFGYPVGMERLQRFRLFADTDEFYRLSNDLPDR